MFVSGLKYFRYSNLIVILEIIIIFKCKFVFYSDISEVVVDRSALALVNGKVWDMHRPLEEECSVELLHFHQDDPFHVNRTFWRSCSFLLGYACEAVFGDQIPLHLHSFPAPNGNQIKRVFSRKIFKPPETEVVKYF